MAGKSCSDDVVAQAASMPVAVVHEVLPAILDRCQHVSALLTEGEPTPAGTLCTGIRLTGEGQRQVLLMRDYVVRA